MHMLCDIIKFHYNFLCKKMLRVLELTECQLHCETAVFSVDIQNVYGYWI